MPYSQSKLDPRLLKSCIQSIKEHLGNIDDLPRELANTIVNLYYRQECYLANIEEYPNFLSPEEKAQSDVFVGVRRFIEASSFDIVFKKNMPEMVKSIRNCKEEFPPYAFRILVDSYVFMLKYRYKKAFDTPPILRWLKKLFMKPIEEIPNLIDFISRSDVDNDKTEYPF